jgi:hypothetical protein
MAARRHRRRTSRDAAAYKYVAVARGYRGNELGRWRGNSLKGVMWTAQENAPKGAEIVVRSDKTSDGHFWGEGKGRVEAAYEKGRWSTSYGHARDPKREPKRTRAARDSSLKEAVDRLAVGESVDVRPNGYIKKKGRNEFVLVDRGNKERNRWGTREEILADASHYARVGSLPEPRGKHRGF